jgi:D-glycero-D-manno-heptose 1,7-bisphosphate phosphatase
MGTADWMALRELDPAMRRAIFLDRDNTLIANDGDLGDPRRVALLRGAAAAVSSLRGLGYAIVVVTNQGGVARGKYSEADVDAVNYRIAELVKKTSGAVIDRFYYCPYHPEATIEDYRRDHPWRKPAPGMLLQASRDMDIDLVNSWMIGDQVRDVAAGQAAGTRTIYLTGDHPAESADHGGADYVARNLVEAARIIAQQPRVEPSLRAPAAKPPMPPMTHLAPAVKPGVPSVVAESKDKESAPAPAATSGPGVAAQAEDPPKAQPVDAAPASPAPSGEDLARKAAGNPTARRITIGLLQIASLALVVSAWLRLGDPRSFMMLAGGAAVLQIAVVAMVAGDRRGG